MFSKNATTFEMENVDYSSILLRSSKIEPTRQNYNLYVSKSHRAAETSIWHLVLTNHMRHGIRSKFRTTSGRPASTKFVILNMA